MASNGARAAVVVAAVAAVVVLFAVLSGGEDDEPATTTQATTTEAKAGDGGAQKQEKPKPKPKVPTIEVRNGQPVGGVQELEFIQGERMRFRVTSDAPAVFHLHGYDVEQSVDAGGSTTFDMPADIEGVFELEDHESLEQIGEVTVSPS